MADLKTEVEMSDERFEQYKIEVHKEVAECLTAQSGKLGFVVVVEKNDKESFGLKILSLGMNEEMLAAALGMAFERVVKSIKHSDDEVPQQLN
ncbi:MAG TPA: hypothetical protein PLQ34_07765 [Ferrovaceae bacterium]|nr:hypothetical protein [Ferrovaceae bacterium]